MASLGQHLRELRTRRNMSLEDIARATRVAPRYLEALEADNLGALPAPTFARGFIRAYCQALGEAPDESLALYDGSDKTVPASPSARQTLRAPAASEPDGMRSRSTVLVSFILLVVLGMALFAVTLMINPAREDGDRRLAEPIPDAPAAVRAVPTPVPTPPGSRSAVSTGVHPPPPRPGASAGATATASAPQGMPSAAPKTPPDATPTMGSSVPSSGSPAVRPTTQATPPASQATPPASATLRDLSNVIGFVASPYRLVARTSEPTWVRVRMADGRTVEETVPAGQVREWVSNEPFVLTIGNAGGVSLELNGRQLPSLGTSGSVITRLVLPPER